MTTSSFRARTLACALLASTAICVLAVPAQSQTAPTIPPVRQAIDDNGVDVVLGTFNVSTTDLSIGAADYGLVFARQWRGNSWRHNHIGTISGNGTKMTVSFGGSSDSFTLSGAAYVADEGNGATLVLNGDYVYTSSDGTVAIFAPPTGQRDVFNMNVGRVRSITRPDGHRVDFHYVEQVWSGTTYFRLQSVTNNAGYQLKLSYGSNTITDAATLAQWRDVIKVTAINNTVEACDPIANSCSLTHPWPFVTYAKVGNLETVSDEIGVRATYRTEYGRMFGIKRAGATSESVIIGYDSSQRVRTILKDGVSFSYTWTDLSPYQRRVQKSGLGGTPLGSVKSHVPTTLILEEHDAMGWRTSYTHDANGRIAHVTGPEGDVTSYAYDARGNVTTATRTPKLNSTLAAIVTSASYDASCLNPATCNRPNSTTDAAGNVTNYSYNTAGQLTQVLHPAASAGGARPRVDYGYSVSQGVSLLTSTSACRTLSSCAGTADEVKTTFSYDTNLLPATTSSGAGDASLTATTAYAYDAIGNVIATDGPLAGDADTVRARWNVARELVGVVAPDPDGSGPLKHRAQRFTRNADRQITLAEQGTVNGVTDADWSAFAPLQAVSSTYDENTRKVKDELQANGATYAVSQYSHDSLGRLDCSAVRMNPAAFTSLPTSACTLGTQGTFGPDRIVKRFYTGRHVISKIQAALGTPEQADEVTVTYTPTNKVATLTDGEGNRTTYEYDGHDRLVKTRFPSPTTDGVSSTADAEELSYDSRGNVIQRKLRDGQVIAYVYDNLSRLTQKDLPSSEPDVSFGYDLLGSMNSASQSGHVLAFTYDALGRNLTQTGPFGDTVSTWDAAGRRTRLTYTDGFFVEHDYLVTGEMKAIRENGVTSGAGVLATFEYDDLGQRTKLIRGNGTSTSYSYDPVSRLSQLSQDFTGTGHDLQLNFAHNPAAQIISVARSNDLYAWTGHGSGSNSETSNGLNQITNTGMAAVSYDARHNLTSSGGLTYGFNSENHLISASNGASVFYDGLGRLRDTGLNGVPMLHFESFEDMILAERNSAGAYARRHVYGPGVDEPLVWYEGSARRYLHADERGSIIGLSDDTGNSVSTFRYDEYGRFQKEAGQWGARFGYTGQFFFSGLGLVHYKARVYSPDLGRFLQPDPIGYGDGMNLYSYVRNDPVNLVDPSGLCTAIERQNGCVVPDDPGIVVTGTRIVTYTGDNLGVMSRGAPTPSVANLESSSEDQVGPPIVVTGTRIPCRTGVACRPATPFWKWSAPVSRSQTSRPDYCGSEGTAGVPDRIGTVELAAACSAHDACYGTIGARKIVCDARFFRDIVVGCTSRSNHYLYCTIVAGTYTSGVNTEKGFEAFRRAQMQAQ